MTSPTAKCPIEIRSPRLSEIDIQQATRRTFTASITVKSAEKTYILTIEDPRMVQNQMAQVSVADIQDCFDENCRMLQVFPCRATIEFWGDQGFLGRTVKGSSLQVA